ncbi:amino acid ABC transporter substrate-binding protein [Bradyrhizobium diazoefficiens]|nr:amino acid ABC transporter substrate-binding protein [Bradyrhizobium diazoefficiens]QQO23457.1 amino acid ABC transporter substrate-binding protein [Bradyrhizobium diazoefficiens]
MKPFCALLAVATMIVTPAFAADTSSITIGFTASRTGPLNVDSTGQERGFEFWRDEVNSKGGIQVGDKRYQVKFASYDDQSVGGRVQQLYTRLVNQDKADFLFSPYSSGLTAAAAVISEQYGKIMIDSGGAEEKPFQLGSKHLFMVITSAGHYLSGAIAALKEKNPHAKIAMVYSDDPFSKTVLAAAKEQAKEAGLEVVMDESYAPSTTDFGPIVNKIISSNADAFMGGGHYSDGATLARQMYDQKANLKWISILVAPADDKFSELGAAALGVTVPSQWEPQVNYKPQFGPTTEEFAKAFEAKLHQKADYHVASGYTAGVVLQHAIEKAGSLDTEKVAKALDQTDVTTFFGHIKFAADPKHHGLQVAHEMVLAQWQKANGEVARQVVWPTSAKSADLIYPINAGH